MHKIHLHTESICLCTCRCVLDSETAADSMSNYRFAWNCRCIDHPFFHYKPAFHVVDIKCLHTAVKTAG